MAQRLRNEAKRSLPLSRVYRLLEPGPVVLLTTALKGTRECVINIPTVELADSVVKCGNCSGRRRDKFAAFGLTAPGVTTPKTLHHRGRGQFALAGRTMQPRSRMK